MPDEWSGTLAIAGQPAEEGGLGAEKMVLDGLYGISGRPDAAFALHVGPNLPYGTVGSHPGEFSAGSDTLDLLIRGQGGHAAYPEETIDPVVIAAQTILSLQTIVSRECDPHHFAVLTVARINGGTKNNAIPDEVRLQINIRYYAREIREQLIASIRRIARGIAAAAGVPEEDLPEISLHPDSVPPLKNDPDLTDRCMNTWQEIFGSDHVLDLRPLSGSEDFSFFGLGTPPVPLCYFKIGCDDPVAIARVNAAGKRLPSLHNSRFAPVPEPTIRTGIIAMSAVVLDYLKKR
jgi:hippurate hydrolase